MRKTIFILIGLIVSNCYAQLGSWRQVGKAGAWVNTIAGVGASYEIYTIESNGALYKTISSTGAWTQIGKPEFGNTKFLFTSTYRLYTIEKNGSLYEVNPSDGSWKAVGAAGAWANTIAGVIMNDVLYTVEKSGVLYKTNLTTGTWSVIGNPEFASTKFLFAGTSKLYSIESSGSLYQIDPSNGAWKLMGKPGDWSKTAYGVTMGDVLYSIESSGALYATDLTTGLWKQIGKPEYANTKFMMMSGGKVYTIESSGSLYEVIVH